MNKTTNHVSPKAQIFSPSSKNKVTKKVSRKVIERLTQRLFSTKISSVEQGTRKTMAELVNQFHRSTRVYNKENPSMDNKRKIVIPRSPKLLSVNRNRARTVLSRLEQEEKIAENIKKNHFKAQPFNPKIFSNAPKHLEKQQHKPLKVSEFNFRVEARIEARKVKVSEEPALKCSTFKARPMPHFKPVEVQMRTLKKQVSDQQLKKQKSEQLLKKQFSNNQLKRNHSEKLIRNAHKEDENQKMNLEIQNPSSEPLQVIKPLETVTEFSQQVNEKPEENELSLPVTDEEAFESFETFAEELSKLNQSEQALQDILGEDFFHVSFQSVQE